MTIELPPWLGTLFAFLVCGAALWKGGRDERIGSATLLINMAATVALRDRSWSPVQYGGFAVDVATLAVFLMLALRSSRFWPMAAAAFQLLAVMTHVAKLVDPLLKPWAYITAIVIWTYLLFITLGVGTWNAWRARSEAAGASEDAPG